jgi:hypothetical protein
LHGRPARRDRPGSHEYQCTYGTAKGGGSARYGLTVTVITYSQQAGKPSQEDQAKAALQYMVGVNSLDPNAFAGLGDESASRYFPASHVASDSGHIAVGVRKGAAVIKIEYYGRTRQFFGDVKMSEAEGREAIQRVVPGLIERVATR